MATNDPASPPPVRREATARALIAGCGIGALLAAGNVYTGLKTGFIDSCSIPAALIGFMLFSGARSLSRHRYGVLENNITQTTASSAAIMGFALGAAGPIPALGLGGRTLPAWAMVAWGLAASALGIGAAVILRRKLIVADNLPFPTGNATGEVIETIQAARATALRRGWLLAGTAFAAAVITWFREGAPKIIPQSTAFPGAVAGISFAALTLAIGWSPLLAAVGGMIGPRGGASLLLGGVLSYGVIAPRLLSAGIVREAEFGAMAAWLVWPALGLLLAGSFVPLLLDAGAVRRAFRDLGALARGGSARAAATDPGERPVGSRVLAAVFLTGIVGLVIVGRAAFGIGPGIMMITVVIALLLTNVSARATGETDVAPVGAVGMLTQIVFAGAGTMTTLMTGGASLGASTQACQMLYSFRAGQRFGASPRAQVGAQILGAVLGAAVVVPTYLLLVKTYGIGTEVLPAASARSWKALAEAVVGNAASLPAHAPLAGLVGLGVGVALVLCARTRIGRYVPSPAAMGMAMAMPGSNSVTIFVGAMALLVARRIRPDISDSTVLTIAAGGMAGESLMAVVIAALTALGAL